MATADGIPMLIRLGVIIIPPPIPSIDEIIPPPNPIAKSKGKDK
jgi:hypothetical protein